MSDNVNNPSHYNVIEGVQPIDICRHLGFCPGNAMKYLARHPYKGKAIEDLQKAVKYLEWTFEELDERTDVVVNHGVFDPQTAAIVYTWLLKLTRSVNSEIALAMMCIFRAIETGRAGFIVEAMNIIEVEIDRLQKEVLQ